MPSTPPFAPGPDLRGQLLGDRYLLGWGGMATVYAAVDRKLRRQVAVKAVFPEHTRTPMQRRRILQEAVLGAQIEHPHVVPILDVGEESRPGAEPLMYLVMPRIFGPSLRTIALDRPLPWRRAVDLVIQLLAGLAALHRLGALHRDIKPENCLVARVDGRDHLRLADLGLAKAVRPGLFSHPPTSQSGALIGTATYLSPEQAQGHALDERSDLYAVGVVLYELLTHRTPFAGKYLELLNAHVYAEPPALAEVAPGLDLPADLEAIVGRALSKAADDRYQTAEAFRAELERAQAGGTAGPAAHRRCPASHRGCEAAQASLAAWTRFEYTLAHDEATLAANLHQAWSPLKLLMSELAEA